MATKSNTTTKPKTTAGKPVETEKKVEKPETKKDMKIRMKATYCGSFGVLYYGEVYTIDGKLAELFIKNDEAEEVKD